MYLRFDRPATALVVGLAALFALPACKKDGDSGGPDPGDRRGRQISQNNLKQIGLAIHNYHDATGHLPRDITDSAGKPLLSWRVAILPYIEQENIYRMFKLNEPWDSPANKQWSQTAIKTFVSPNTDQSKVAGMTHYQGFVGPGTAFEPGKKWRLLDFLDGTSNSILVVETAEAVEWAKPGGLPFDPKGPPPKFGGIFPGGANVLFADASVRFLSDQTPPNTVKAFITINGGETVPSE